MRGLTKLLVLCTVLLVAGCTTINNDGPVPASYIQQTLTGRSWMWVPGGPGAGIYFGANGEGQVSWNGKVKKVKWHARDGRFCYTGSGGSCWLLYRSGGKMYSRATSGGSPYPWHPLRDTKRGNFVF
ncbi:hypothetical protein [Oricola thermophila]|uniref:DUF995 domain-containing protein n=1 Tax=Oricola thermophila TaxID=2742145 RepID=A0A6N1VDC9_9HYPH|nr:hypothetical protein [Oricola thermophila]QKV18523.1 hypothetical protein HTY61_08695 [Oricola thermophila]